MSSDGGRVQFRVLGTVEAVRDGHPIALGSARQRAVLVAFLLRPNQALTLDQLGPAVWDEVPASARSNLRTFIAALRNQLGRTHELRTTGRGYQLTVAPEDVDLQRFQALRDDGESALRQGEAAAAAALLRDALNLWRGDAFADVPRTQLLDLEATRLHEQRLATVECYADARLAAGRAEEVVADLRGLVLEHPLRERLWALLMTALYRCGRQADALAAYSDVRRCLAEELGIEPGPQLHRLRDQILRADAALDGPSPDAPSLDLGESAETPPSQLPPAVADFTGRAPEVARLRDGLADAATGPVWTISGAAGVGKTSLALHVAHLVRGSYPDGQLYLNLRGAEHRPIEPATALDRLLRALGVPGAGVPAPIDERIALYRSRLADRRVLVVLDNAADEAQLRPLLPGSPTASVLVTSRTVLAGLEGANVVPLGVLAPHEALHLLRRVVGDTRVAAEPVAAGEIVDRCGRLPLAVRVGAARLVGRPHWRLERLAARLADQRRRLDELRAGDLDVRASLALSYDGLRADERRAFRLLSLLDAPDFPSWVVAPLLDTSPERADDLVESLVDTGLVEVAGEDSARQVRFRMHDLLRTFGRELAAGDSAGRELAAGDGDREALGRLFDAWLDLVEGVGRRAAPQAMRIEYGPCPRYRHAETLASTVIGDPVAWFDDHWPTLRSTVEQASAGSPERAWRLAAALAPLCDVRSQFDEWDAIHDLALGCVRRLGPSARRGEAILLQQRGLLRCRQNRFAEASEEFQRARDAFESVGDGEGAAYGWHGIGWMHEWQGRPDEALACHRRAMAGFTESHNEHGMVEVLCSLGAIERRAGRFEAAREHLYQARELTNGRGNADEMFVVLELGRLHAAQGDTATAITFFELSLASAVRWNDLDVASNVRLFLAETHLRAGAVAQAREQIDRAAEFFQRQKDRAGEAWSWRLLSHAHRVSGDVDVALDYAHRAADAAGGLDMPAERAKALAELARARAAAGRADEASSARDEALAWFDSAGFAAEAADLR